MRIKKGTALWEQIYTEKEIKIILFLNSYVHIYLITYMHTHTNISVCMCLYECI